MKKHYLCIGVLSLMLGTTVYGQDISIYMNNKSVEMDVRPEEKENTTYVPIKFICKELGASVKWQELKVIITKGENQIIYTIGDKIAYKNGNPILLSHRPYLSTNRVFIPLDSINKLLDCHIDFTEETNKINIIPNNFQEIDGFTDLPQIRLVNHHSNFVVLPRKWNHQVFNTLSMYKAIWKYDTATTNIYRPQVNEFFEFNFVGKEPDKVTVTMEYLTNNLEESGFPKQSVPVVKNDKYYGFNHQPILDPSGPFGSALYSIEATWGENVCEYGFVIDNKWTFRAYEKLEERMKNLGAMDYCIVGNWVYYVVLGDEEGFHKMLLDGSQDTRICDFSNVTNIGGSLAITSEYEGDMILYKMQSLREYDENGNVCEDPHPIDYYKLNLSNHTLEQIKK